MRRPRRAAQTPRPLDGRATAKAHPVRIKIFDRTRRARAVVPDQCFLARLAAAFSVLAAPVAASRPGFQVFMLAGTRRGLSRCAWCPRGVASRRGTHPDDEDPQTTSALQLDFAAAHSR